MLNSDTFYLEGVLWLRGRNCTFWPWKTQSHFPGRRGVHSIAPSHSLKQSLYITNLLIKEKKNPQMNFPMQRNDGRLGKMERKMSIENFYETIIKPSSICI